MSGTAPTRKRLTAEARRAEILEAASAVFSTRGYHSASIDHIAEEAGVSKALIYEHFSSKQELHAKLVEEGAAELYRRLAAAVPRAEGSAARLEAGLDAFFGFVEERRHAWRVLFHEAADPETVAVLDRMLAQVTDVVAELIAAEPGAQALPDDPVEREQGIHLIAQMLVGGAQAVANWWTDNSQVPRAELVETAMDFAWLGLDRLTRGERWSVG